MTVTPLLAGNVDLEPVLGWGVVAAIAPGHDAREAGADLRLHVWQDLAERVAVIGIAGQRLHMGDELAAFGAMQRRGDRDFHAKLVGPVRVALADAFDLRRMERIDLFAALVLALAAHPPGERERQREELLQSRLALDLAYEVARHPAQIAS